MLNKRKHFKNDISVIILAAGSSTRFGEDKLFLDILDIPCIIHSILAFENIKNIDEIIIVTKSSKISYINQLLNYYKIKKVSKIVSGGKTRSESAYKGFNEVNNNSKYIFIHDAARPLISEKLILKLIEKVYSGVNCCLGVKAKDTVKKVLNNKEGLINKTLNRENLYLIQTPQAFLKEDYKKALDFFINDKNNIFTDDASLFEKISIPVYIVKGSYTNIKITTIEDYIFAIALLNNKDKLVEF